MVSQQNDNEAALTVPHSSAYRITPQLQMSTSGPAYNLEQQYSPYVLIDDT